MQMVRVGIIGASGYSGLELTRLVLRHRNATLAFATSDRWAGQRVSKYVAAPTSLEYVAVERVMADAKSMADVVFLATPAETSLELGPRLHAQGLKVVDLSGAFRLKNLSEYNEFYRFQHTAPELNQAAVYGLPELFRTAVKTATFVANPGCYATAAALSVAPLLRAKLVDPTTLVMNAASGVSGAGRKASEDYSFMEIDADFRAYRTLRHQHVPEVRQTLAQVAQTDVSLVFTPHLLPMKRGILCTSVARLMPRVTVSQVREAFDAAYANEPLISLKADADAVRIAEVANTPRTSVGFSVDTSTVVAISALDNLLKGASSQAMQNFNLMCGFDELEGLS